MANLTLVIDEDLLRRARIKALEHGTSVNAVVRALVEQYVGEPDQMLARRAIVAHARNSTWSSGSGGRVWTRDDLYDERIARHDATVES